MKDVRVLSLDDRARIVIPQSIRKSIGLTIDSKIMLVADTEKKKIEIIPVAIGKTQNPLKLKITVKDVPGALGKISTLFGNMGLSILYCEAIVAEKDKIGIITVIIPSSEYEIEKLKRILLDQGMALKVELIPLD